MKQRWYPSGLVPRTYFAQGGDAIRVSSYLRDFFNDVCDSFIPTNRYTRVDGNRLLTYHDGHFLIYDLTSFTSNFHEQREFLYALSAFFSGVPVFCVGYGLKPILNDLGSMIADYAEVINTSPRYRFHEGLFQSCEDLVLVHNVAGFLGVPGNLATCTYAHGTFISQHTKSTDQQSCAGDDGCIACKDSEQQFHIQEDISRLGIAQAEKFSLTLEAASYLKRRFVQSGLKGILVERVEFILLSVVHAYRTPDPRFESLSHDKSKLRSSIACSAASLIRSLYQYTKGTYLDGELDLILDFLRYVYDRVALPIGGELRGMMLEDSELREYVKGTIVFPLERKFFLNDPDMLFSELFTPWIVVVPEMTDVESFDFEGEWFSGETRCCRMDPSLEKLVKYGWLSRKQTPKKVLVGPDARLFFRRLLRDEISSLEFEYTSLQDISSECLQEIGVYEFFSPGISRPKKRRKFYHSSVFDPDDPVILSLRQQSDPCVRDSDENMVDALSTTFLDY